MVNKLCSWLVCMAVFATVGLLIWVLVKQKDCCKKQHYDCSGHECDEKYEGDESQRYIAFPPNDPRYRDEKYIQVTYPGVYLRNPRVPEEEQFDWYGQSDYYEEKYADCPDPLAVFQGQNQAFCANTWCHPDGETATCDCPVFNSYGLAPLSSFNKYKDDKSVIVSTYDILQGAKQPKPKMCFGKYIDCYGEPCSPDYSKQGLSKCHCKVKEGPFLTASSTCGPDKHGNLPNGASVAAQDQGIATANSIISIANVMRGQG